MRISKSKSKRRLVLIDGHSILFRAFHAFPPLTTSKGELINAVYGFTNILLTVIKDLEPTHIAVCFDRSEPTFRHEAYAEYKAHRPEAPEELTRQQDRVEEVVSVLNIPIFAVAGYEADDVIGTLARQAISESRKTQKTQKARVSDKSEDQRTRGSGSLKGWRSDSSGSPSFPSVPEPIEVVIVTGDRDAFQLVDDEQVLVYTPARGKQVPSLWDAKAVREKYGLKATQLIDFKALAGDASDEIPGVKGIGPKTTTNLLQEYGDLERIYKNLSNVRKRFGKAIEAKLVEGKEAAKLSRRLAAIELNVPIKLSLEASRVHDYDKGKAIEKFTELEFASLIKKLPKDSFEQMVQEEMF